MADCLCIKITSIYLRKKNPEFLVVGASSA